MHACSPTDLEMNHKFQASLGHTMRSCIKIKYYKNDQEIPILDTFPKLCMFAQKYVHR